MLTNYRTGEIYLIRFREIFVLWIIITSSILFSHSLNGCCQTASNRKKYGLQNRRNIFHKIQINLCSLNPHQKQHVIFPLSNWLLPKSCQTPNRLCPTFTHFWTTTFLWANTVLDVGEKYILFRANAFSSEQID